MKHELTDLETYLAILFTAYRRDVDDAAATLYERALADVPLALLDAAITRAVRTRRFFPTVAELREDAEHVRTEIAARLPFEPCVACRELTPGWVDVTDPAGVSRKTRCDCWHAHQTRLARAGWTPKAIALPAPEVPS